ncbi:ExeA family protein, partial [Magnetococcales bacterium HHB-1]
MYLDHFGLQRFPFSNTPDTSLFFDGGRRREILEALVYTVMQGDGITKVIGEVGSGKTTLCRMLIDALPPAVDVAFLANPSLSPDNIFQAIAGELGVSLEGIDSRLDELSKLQAFLIERHAQSRQVVVLVEEAQGMPLETLEQIRLLSNLETGQHKLLQMVLFGQPELNKNLSGHNVRQLRERITHAFELPELNREEVGSYLNNRVWSTGRRGSELFSLKAVQRIARFSGGLPRRVNILAHKSLMAAFISRASQVDVKHVQAAIKDTEFGRWSGFSFSGFPGFSLDHGAFAAGGTALVIAAGVLFSQWDAISAVPTEKETQAAAAQQQILSAAPIWTPKFQEVSSSEAALTVSSSTSAPRV